MVMSTPYLAMSTTSSSNLLTAPTHHHARSFSSDFTGPSSPGTGVGGDLAADASGSSGTTSLAAFCRRANISEKQLLEFNRDEAAAAVKGLEKAVTDLAAVYYAEEVKRIKKTLGLMKKAQPRLLVRQNFKIGFLSEFQGDTAQALKHYTRAFRDLQVLPVDRACVYEYACVADFINFKICRILLLSRSQLTAAVQQFESLVRQFRPHQALALLEHSHWSWMSRQFEVFAQLLERYLVGKTTVPKHLHAGFYYHAASHHAMKQKATAQHALQQLRDDPSFVQLTAAAVSSSTPSSSSPSPASSMSTSKLSSPLILSGEYHGDLHSIHALYLSSPLEHRKAPDSEDHDRDLRLRILASEAHVDHSKLILSLLLRAYEVYLATKRSPRLVLRIAVEMALEHASDLSEESQRLAKASFDRVAREYRSERWWPLLATVLTPALGCSSALRLSPDYCLYALELLKPQITPDVHERARIQQQLISQLSNQPPTDQLLPPLATPIELNLNDDIPLFSVRPQFQQDRCRALDPTHLSVQLVSHLALPVTLAKISVATSDAAHSFVLDNVSGSDPQFVLHPEVPSVLTFPFTPTVRAFLECRTVELQLGTAPSSVVFRWSLELDRHADHALASDSFQLDPFPSRPATAVETSRANVQISLSCAGPAMVSEMFAVQIKIHNVTTGELAAADIKSSLLMFEMEPDANSTAAAAASSFSASTSASAPVSPQTGPSFFHPSNLQKPIQRLSIGAVAAESSVEATLYFYSHTECKSRRIHFSYRYSTPQLQTIASASIEFPVAKPLTTRCTIYSMKFQLVGTDTSSPAVLVGEPCLVRFQIESLASRAIELLDFKLDLDDSIATLLASSFAPDPIDDEADLSSSSSDDRALTGIPSSMTLLPENQISVWYQLQVKAPGPAQKLGRLLVSWKRVPDEPSPAFPINVSAIAMPALKVA
ncbi:MAG: hypothetical protein Q8P67_17660, partial [archaeon]|nr:hypothetical protein [archaeon]